MELLIDKIKSVVRNSADAEQFGQRTMTYGFVASTFEKLNIDRDESGNRFASLLDELDFVACLDLVCDWFGDIEHVDGKFTGKGIYKFSKATIDNTPVVIATYECRPYV